MLCELTHTEINTVLFLQFSILHAFGPLAHFGYTKKFRIFLAHFFCSFSFGDVRAPLSVEFLSVLTLPYATLSEQ